MRPRFGPAVALRGLPVAIDLPAATAREPIAIALTGHTLPMLDAQSRAWLPPATPAVAHTLRLLPLIATSHSVVPAAIDSSSQVGEWTVGVTSRQASWQDVSVLSRFQPLPPLVTRATSVADFDLEPVVHAADALGAPRVRQDLEAARRQPASKRVVSARLLSDAQRAHWIERVAQAKRLAIRGIDLIGVIPDVALAGDRPVSYRAEEGAIAYMLSDKPVALSTVVIARNRASGEMLLARFASE